MSGSGTGIVTPYNTHRGIDFGGAADYYARAADLVGNADGALGTLSIWFRIDGGNGAVRVLFADSLFRIFLALDAANRLWLRGQTAAPATILQLVTNVAYLAGTGWRHAEISWDLTAPAAQIYVDGAVPGLTTNTALVGVIDYARPAATWGFGGNAAGGQLWNGALSEGYVNFAEYLDLSVEANRWLHRHPNGQPPNIGADGSSPTGNQPIMYFAEVGGAMVNLGSGGAFAAVGAPALSADSPKDRWVTSLIRGSRKRRVYATGG